MKWLIAAVLTLTVGIGGTKSAYEYFMGYVDIQKAAAYAEARARYAPDATAVPPAAAAIASGLCTGAIPLDAFAADMGLTQEDLDAYAQRYADAGKTCDELTYLGSVTNPDGSVDYVYRIVTAGRQNWYVFTVTDGLVSNIQ